jgi:hypothetical protein
VLILFNCAIHEVPKTGTEYMKWKLWANRLFFIQTHIPGVANPKCGGIQAEVLGPHSPHCTPTHAFYQILKANNAPRLAIIRHPLTWLRSYWAFRQEHVESEMTPRTWDDERPLDAKCRDADFRVFVDKFIANYPGGLIGKFFASYTQDATHTGYQEELDRSLSEFIYLSMGKELKAKIGKQNTTHSANHTYRGAQAEKILGIEHELCREHGYDYIPEGVV